MKETINSSGTNLSREEILSDFRLANLSRSLSIIGRKEVLTGKAKFGIFGAGKELIQIAIAKQFKDGDWRSGYYRDQTWMMAMGLYNSLEFFHQLYGNTSRDIRGGSGGRVFNNHFAIPNINKEAITNITSHQSDIFLLAINKESYSPVLLRIIELV